MGLLFSLVLKTWFTQNKTQKIPTTVQALYEGASVSFRTSICYLSYFVFLYLLPVHFYIQLFVYLLDLHLHFFPKYLVSSKKNNYYYSFVWGSFSNFPHFYAWSYFFRMFLSSFCSFLHVFIYLLDLHLHFFPLLSSKKTPPKNIWPIVWSQGWTEPPRVDTVA